MIKRIEEERRKLKKTTEKLRKWSQENF